MRGITIGLLLLGTLIYPKSVKALDCGSLHWPSLWQRSPDSGDIPEEMKRRDAEARGTLAWLEGRPIVLRGRIVSERYLTNPRKTDAATSLVTLDQVEVIRGQLTAASRDRKAFILQAIWCDGGCSSKPGRWRVGETVLIGAFKPSESVRKSHKGRVDAALGMCGPDRLPSMALELLNAPEDEIIRLKRDYQLRYRR